MKYLKAFEEAQIKWYNKGIFDHPIEYDYDNDNDNDNDNGIINMFPFTDLKFGKDGKLFKCGDRVEIDIYKIRKHIKDQTKEYKKIKGTIITCYLNANGGENYFVCADQPIVGKGTSNTKYNVPDDYGIWIYTYQLRCLKHITLI